MAQNENFTPEVEDSLAGATESFVGQDEWCPQCQSGSYVSDASEEQDGFEERAVPYTAVHFACGHSDAVVAR